MRFAKKIIILFVIISLTGGMVIFWLWDTYNQRRLAFLKSEQEQVQNQYSTTVNSYRLVSQTLNDEVVNTKAVLSLLSEAEKAKPENQADIRKKLYDQFLPMYNRLRTKNFKQLNLYLPDTTNFLSMYKPEVFGEVVGPDRPSIRLAVEKKQYVEGFEEGKLFNGFRYIFPLLDDGKLVGLLETSVSFSTFQQEMSGSFPMSYRFMLKKQVVGDTTFAEDTRSYYVSDFSNDYYLEIESEYIKRVDAISDDVMNRVNLQLKQRIQANLEAGQLFSEEIQFDGVNYLITFVPIDNVAGAQVAYLVGYHQIDDLYVLRNDLYIRYIFTFALVAAVLFLAYYIYDSQRKILDAGERLRNITTAMGEGLLLVTYNTQVVFFHPAAEFISGYRVGEVLGKNYDKTLRFVFEEGDQNNDGFIDAVLKRNITVRNSKDIYILQKDGNRVPLSVSAAPMRLGDSQVIGCIVVFRDITQEREIDRSKTEFVSLASHQLKTPLSAVNWYAEMLLDGDAGPINERQKEFLNEIAKGNQRMVKLVNSLLNVSRIDMGALSIIPELVDLCEVTDSVIGEQKFAIEAKEQKIIKNYSQGLPKINLDLSLIRIVLQNVISNAIKYTREQGQIEITMKTQGVNMMIEVKDNGYGIPKKEQPQIFGKLFRADNVKSKKVEGTGLGLYVAKAVVEAFGGKIWFESTENKGTSFFITLPLAGVAKKEGSKGLENNT